MTQSSSRRAEDILVRLISESGYRVSERQGDRFVCFCNCKGASGY